MSSPFPGMDPYLEARSTWPGVHAAMITYSHENLQPQLRPKYIARIGERVQLVQISQSYVPDVCCTPCVNQRLLIPKLGHRSLTNHK